ncbi:MAG TPA: hypothetical protein VKA67_12865, partial [Verrucomicrobiae bacterium]|nr:hypothetical protein [Verrucomicrobiae bacterium]
VDAGLAAMHEPLVKFIAGGIERNDEHNAANQRPAPRKQIMLPGPAQGTPEQQGKNRVFGKVSAFSGVKYNLVNHRCRHLRKEPVQNGRDDA